MHNPKKVVHQFWCHMWQISESMKTLVLYRNNEGLLVLYRKKVSTDSKLWPLPTTSQYQLDKKKLL